MYNLKSIVISGYYGFDNSGDDAILKAIVKDFKSADKNIDITALSYNPPFTKDVYDINAVNRFNIREVTSAIKNCEIFISGGGSLLQDVTSTRSLLYYLFIIKLAKLYRKKTMVFANGVGPINKKINRICTKRILEQVDLITLRDEGSVDFLKELGVKNENIYLTADPVFTLDAQPKSRIDEIFKDEKIPKDKGIIGISIRDWNNSDKIIEVLSKVIEKIKEEYDVNILLIPMHYPEDLKISEKLLDNFSDSVYILRKKYAVDEIMGIISELEILIAMRLHSLIYAATQGTPMVGLVYDPKIVGFLESIDVDSMINIEELNTVDLLKHIAYVWDNRRSIKQSLINKENHYKNKALKNIDLALQLLEK